MVLCSQVVESSVMMVMPAAKMAARLIALSKNVAMVCCRRILGKHVMMAIEIMATNVHSYAK